MSNRFKAIGSFVYEKGNRIGATPDEASVELARKLNAYQMRIERLKAEVERLTHLANQSEFYRSQLQKDACRLENIQMQDAFRHYEAENARLKAEVERLRKAGDNLITALDKRDDVFDNSDKRQAIADWNAAKEDRPNE